MPNYVLIVATLGKLGVFGIIGPVPSLTIAAMIVAVWTFMA
jgi:hypothetical protein